MKTFNRLNYNLLIVDDVPENIYIATNMLGEDSYNITAAFSGEEALSYINIDTNHFDLILLDIMMPNIDGFSLCKQIKSRDDYKDVPIIFLTAKLDIDSLSHAFEVGASDYVRKPFHVEELLSRVKSHLELYHSRMLLKEHHLSLQIKSKREKKRLLDEVEETQKEMLDTLTEFISSVSLESGEHIKRVAYISKLLATYHPALTKEDADVLYHAAPMHDIGKATIPHKILTKPTALTKDEFEIMKTHTLSAHKFLRNSQRKIFKAADIVALQHHEKWDGSGYPKGLKGEEIHLYGRIVALADVFDALVHKRVYKKAWSIEETIRYIINSKGTQFDPQIVDIFLEHVDKIIDIVKPT